MRWLKPFRSITMLRGTITVCVREELIDILHPKGTHLRTFGMLFHYPFKLFRIKWVGCTLHQSLFISMIHSKSHKITIGRKFKGHAIIGRCKPR